MSDLIDRQAAIDAINGMPSVTPKQFADSDKMVCEDAVSRAEVKKQMLKYGFHAPDMTVTEFVEDCLPSVTPKPSDCEDAVSRQAVRNAFWELFCNRPLDSDKYVISVCEKAVMDLPSVTPKPKTGKWVPFLLPCVDGTAMHVWQCDQCETNQVIESNYCPDCGSYNGGDTDA